MTTTNAATVTRTDNGFTSTHTGAVVTLVASSTDLWGLVHEHHTVKAVEVIDDITDTYYYFTEIGDFVNSPTDNDICPPRFCKFRIVR